MNRIEVKQVKTCYDYSEYYRIIDGIPITKHLDRCPKGSLANFKTLLGLPPPAMKLFSS